MCRYFSGFFYHHPLLADVDYYWRIEPDVHYYCDLDYDPFLFMQQRWGILPPASNPEGVLVGRYHACTALLQILDVSRLLV